MESLFGSLTLVEKGGELIDITARLKQLTSKLDVEGVVKDPDFDLFKGTHALEINNVKLDSTLLELTREEVEFDCDRAYGASIEERLVYVTSITDRLCCSLMDWLNDYQSLPTTVLSCRYVEHLGMCIKNQPNCSIDKARLKTGCELYDTVLSSCIFASFLVINFVNGLLRAGVVYEEEDLSCNTMGLGVLSDGSRDAVLAELRIGLSILSEKYPKAKRLFNIVFLFENLLKIPEYRPLVNFPPSKDFESLHSIIAVADKLDEQAWYRKLPPGSFSQGIQKRLSNQFPPKELYEQHNKEYKMYKSMAQDILKVVEVHSAINAFEIRQFSWFFNRCKQRHVVARALFPLYLMRDDQSVLGLYSFSEFTHQTLLHFSLSGTELQKTISQGDDPDIESELNKLYQEISIVNFEWYQNISQNVCRYRQGYNKQLVLWDSLQANLEQFETELENRGIVDKIEHMDNAPLMPISTWLYYMKLVSMIEYVLKGFELELYKEWEHFTMNWYVYYLCQHLSSCLQKIMLFLEQRITSIRNIKKRVKKTKPGPKKEKLRQTYHELTETIMPQLCYNLKSIEFLNLECILIKSIVFAQVFVFGILKSYDLIDNKHHANTNFTTNEYLYNLRFKSFSSIGIPHLPDFNSFEESLHAFTLSEPNFSRKLEASRTLIEKELLTAKKDLISIIDCIKADHSSSNISMISGTRLVKDEALNWFESINVTIDQLQKNTNKILQTLPKSPNRPDGFSINFKYPPGACKYFPLLSLEKC